MDTIQSDTDFTSRTAAQGNATYVLFFNAVWCGPGRMARPATESAATGLGLPVFEVDIEACPEAASSLGVQNPPTLIVMKGASRAYVDTGAKSADEYKQIIQRCL